MDSSGRWSSDVAMEAVVAAYNIRRETPFYYYLHLFSAVFHHTRRRLRGGSELYQFSPYIMMACGIKKSSSARNEVSRAVAPPRGGLYIPRGWRYGGGRRGERERRVEKQGEWKREINGKRVKGRDFKGHDKTKIIYSP